MTDLLEQAKNTKKTPEIKDPDELFEEFIDKQKSVIQKIQKETGLPPKEIIRSIKEKKDELKGLISDEGALFAVGLELGVDLPQNKPTLKEKPKTSGMMMGASQPEPKVKIVEKESTKEEVKVEAPKTTEPMIPPKQFKKPEKSIDVTPIEETNYEIIPSNPLQISVVDQSRPLTMEEKKLQIDQTMELLNYMASSALKEEDFWIPPRSKGQKVLTMSGCNKLGAIFNISTRTLKIWVVKEVNIKGEEDIVAYATVRAERLGGSFVEITANKALSEYESDKPGAKKPIEWVNMQTLKGTAETRARNRAIIRAIGFVPKGYKEVTKEELNSTGGMMGGQ